MDKAYKYAKSAIVNFKLDTCCCFAPIRIGLLVIGYFNIFIALLSLIGTADGGITPPLMEVQDTLLEEEEVSTTAGVVAYACELGFSIVLLCALYRNDTVLLRVYIYFLMVTIVTSVLMYSMVIAKVAVVTRILIIGNIVFNGYVIILVRSAIVEIKERLNLEKNGHVVLYSVAAVSHDVDRNVIEMEPIAENAHDEPKIEEIVEEVKNDENGEETKTTAEAEKPAKLETVNENLKEEQPVH
ncbi:uncharacterized protein LOC112057155 [Bicyclus anynana]|uniref:Uncharacterized protein LOC112057155 n=1 Tax=Bicyclus anynana TaxID=110368 RepID=A0A6J1P6F4_BICAN|nr:uncharacterized protein LOC112057155 [Bicyclus anynana]